MMNKLITTQDRNIVTEVESALTQVEKSFAIWNRSHSNYQWKSIVVGSHHTPLRRLRQISAEISNKKNAMEEAKYKYLERTKLAEIKRDKAKNEHDKLQKEYLLLQAGKYDATAKMIEKPYLGAIKDILALSALYSSIEKGIIEKYGKLDEETFEKEEAKYWVMRAFAQSLRDIRQSGVILNGNQELLEQIGLDPSVIHKLLVEYCNETKDDTSPSSEKLEVFLRECAEEYYQTSTGKMERIGFSDSNNFSEENL